MMACLPVCDLIWVECPVIAYRIIHGSLLLQRSNEVLSSRGLCIYLAVNFAKVVHCLLEPSLHNDGDFGCSSVKII